MTRPSDPREPFYAAILDDWESDAPRLALAEWLDRQDDPTGRLRAEMIRLGVEARSLTAEGKPIPPPLASRLEEVEKAFQMAFRVRKINIFEGRFDRGFVNDWVVHRGYAGHYLAWPPDAHQDFGPMTDIPFWFEPSPIPGQPSVDYVRLAENPALRLWGTLPISADGGYSGQLGDDNFATLIRSPHLTALRVVKAFDHDRMVDCADPTPLGVRSLRALADNPALAGLTHLTLWWNGFDDEAARALAASAHLRKLKDLSLADRFTDVAVSALAASPVLDSVESLHLYGPFTGTGLQNLLRSPHLASLRALDLSGYTSGCHELDRYHFGEEWNALDAVGFRALLESPVLSRLEALCLHAPFETPEQTWDELATAVGGMPALKRLDATGRTYLLHQKLPPRRRKILHDFGRRYKAPR
ncbi:MAG TPA: TIGR02996 domain-containing protein [Urbifossiella sp.]|nr:TIGR02996 domain-containing protein [Urbifossiella sp.]